MRRFISFTGVGEVCCSSTAVMCMVWGWQLEAGVEMTAAW